MLVLKLIIQQIWVTKMVFADYMGQPKSKNLRQGLPVDQYRSIRQREYRELLFGHLRTQKSED